MYQHSYTSSIGIPHNAFFPAATSSTPSMHSFLPAIDSSILFLCQPTWPIRVQGRRRIERSSAAVHRVVRTSSCTIRTAQPGQSPVYPSTDCIWCYSSSCTCGHLTPPSFTTILPYAHRLSFPAHCPRSPHATSPIVVPRPSRSNLSRRRVRSILFFTFIVHFPRPRRPPALSRSQLRIVTYRPFSQPSFARTPANVAAASSPNHPLSYFEPDELAALSSRTPSCRLHYQADRASELYYSVQRTAAPPPAVQHPTTEAVTRRRPSTSA